MNINDELYREVAKETNTKVDKVEEACRYMFQFVHDEMEAGTLKPIRLPYFGIFMCKPERIAKLKERGLL